VAPDPEKKWKLILWYETSNTALVDPEDRKYDQYQHAREWMEISGMKMLPEQIPERDELHLWKLFRSARSASNGISIREYKCPMRHQSDCRASFCINRGNCFDSNLLSSWSAVDRDTEEENQYSDYPDLVQDSEDEDDECNKEEEDEGEDEESEDVNDPASDTDQGRQADPSLVGKMVRWYNYYRLL
jgi:hypothetical protein